VYRVISIPGVLKLSTITDKFSGNEKAIAGIMEKISAVVGHLSIKKFYDECTKNVDYEQLLWSETASPTQKVSWSGYLIDAHLLYEGGFLDSWKVIAMTFQHNVALALMDSVLQLQFDPGKKWLSLSNKFSKGKYILGQLATKKEAAGKVRVFAMVDIWTQSVLKPLHVILFKLLKSLPNDGTHDQHAAVLRASAKAEVAKKSYGYDLSAATDRLPMNIQVLILARFFGPKFALAWKHLLVGRDYILDSDEFGYAKVKYEVGQPMGALSSWAMLALTHHVLVQVAYRDAYNIKVFKWWEGYELLGDDIVIFDEKVAATYLKLMSDLGVGINLSKSVIAKKSCCEFAKVTMLNGQNVSAISWKMFIAQPSMMGRVNIVYSLLRKNILYGPKLLRRVSTILRQSRTRQGEISISLLALLAMAAGNKTLPLIHLLSSISEWRPSYSFVLTKVSLDKLRELFKEVFIWKLEASDILDKFPLVGTLLQFYHDALSRRIVYSMQKLKRLAGESLAYDMYEVFSAFMPSQPGRAGDLPLEKATRYSNITRRYPNLMRWHELWCYLQQVCVNRVFNVIGHFQSTGAFQGVRPTKADGPYSKGVQHRKFTITGLEARLLSLEEIARWERFTKIISRAEQKLEKKSDNLEVVDSPLVTVNQMIKAIKAAERLQDTGARMLNRKERRARI
jgi:hypothetical protein